MDTVEYLDYLEEQIDFDIMTEAEYTKTIEHLKLEIIDQNKFIKRNDVREVTNPIFFERQNIPTTDGLLSNEIFGITKETRAGTFAYIDLHGVFMDPSCYKVWTRIDSKIKACVHGTDNFIIDENGHLQQSASGKNGIKFLKDNFDKIKFRRTDSSKRDLKIEYLTRNKDRIFINKYFVIPPFYRDVKSGKNTGVGEINRLYSQLLVCTRSLQESLDYGISAEGMSGRVQELILAIHDWIIGNNNSMIKDPGTGLARKEGFIKKAVLSKTVDYGCRLVLSAPECKVERPSDMIEDAFHASLPLHAALVNFKPFILFHVRRMFENAFGGISTIEVMQKDGSITHVTPKDPLIEFSDERIEKELENYCFSYNNRIKPIQVPVEENNKVYYMMFSGHKNAKEAQENPESIYRRRLSWVDLFYQAAVEATKDKTVLITRFPMDSFYNQFPNEIKVSSTIETEPMVVNGTFYPNYPKIREEMFGTHTGNYFKDTMSIANVQLPSIGGDYDGDMVTSKGSYIVETNDELREYLHSKAFFVDLGCTNVRTSGNEAIQALYSLTKVETGDKLSQPTF